MAEKWRSIRCPECGATRWGFVVGKYVDRWKVECLTCHSYTPVLELEYLYDLQDVDVFLDRVNKRLANHPAALMKISYRTGQRDIKDQLNGKVPLTFDVWRMCRFYARD